MPSDFLAARLRDVPDDAKRSSLVSRSWAFPLTRSTRGRTITGVVVGRLARSRSIPTPIGCKSVRSTSAARTLTIATAATNVAAGQDDSRRDYRRETAANSRSNRAKCAASIRRACCARPPSLASRGLVRRRHHAARPDSPLGADVVELFGLDRDVLDVEVTPNRVDAMSMLGLARELAASFRLPLREPSSRLAVVRPRADAAARHARHPRLPPLRRTTRFDGLTVRPAPADPHSPRPRRPASDQQFGRHLELRDVRNRAPCTSTITRSSDRAFHRARRARRAKRSSTLDGAERELDCNRWCCRRKRAMGLAGLMGGQTAKSATRRERSSSKRQLQRSARPAHDRQARAAQRSFVAKREDAGLGPNRRRRCAGGAAVGDPWSQRIRPAGLR